MMGLISKIKKGLSHIRAYTYTRVNTHIKENTPALASLKNQTPINTLSQDIYIPSLYIPCAFINPDNIHLKTRGQYKEGYPIGAVIHYTAGNNITLNPIKSTTNELLTNAYDKALITLKDASKRNFTYLLIDYYGRIYQCFPLDHWGYHAGQSYYPTLGTDLSNQLIGIELMCGGLLEESKGIYKTWFNKIVPNDKVRTITGPNGNESYEKLSYHQEEALINLLSYLYTNNPTIFNINNILAHSEVSPDRKKDIGSSLSISMDGLRDRVRGHILDNPIQT